MNKADLRVFIGFSEIANFIASYKKGFEAIGHSTYTVVSHRNKYYPHAQYDVVMSEWGGMNRLKSSFPVKILRSIFTRTITYWSFLKALFTCDVFYYNTGGNVLPFRLDYALIKLFGKKLVVIFLGSEIRHWYLYQKELESIGYAELFATCIAAYRSQQFGTLTDKKERVEAAEQYADLILSQPGFAQLQSKPYMRANVGLYLPDYPCDIQSRETPLILHAPSARGVKGTEFVVEALDRLKAEGIAFEFRLIENMPNHELINLLVESDIVVDELNSDTIGVLSTEAMATGNAVLTGYMADFVKVPQPCPVINTNRSNVYENLKRVITERQYRLDLAKQGRAYAEQYHDITRIAQSELDWLFAEPETRKFDFTPAFDARMPIPSNILAEENKGKRNLFRSVKR